MSVAANFRDARYREDSGLSFRAVWVSLADCADSAAPPVYPTGLLELLAKK